jgi:dTDP-4-amino-4,6-dideoxygalactose transaminase
MRLPFFDLTRQYGAIQNEIEEALLRVSASGRYIGGEELLEFEREAADYCSAGFAVGLSSGTSALLATLMALDIGEGDEVITPAFTFIATAEIIAFLGATPVFIDVKDEDFNLDPDLLEGIITERTKCIIAVHLFGQMADMPRIMEIAGKHDIPVVEDAAQAIGAGIGNRRACTFGIAGCLSFFPSKNLGALGDGGMVITNSGRMEQAIRVIKEHGSAVRYRHSRIGFNGRLDAMQAAVLRVKLRHLDTWVDMRRAHAAEYSESLKQVVAVPAVRDGCRHVYNQYSILTEHRDELVEYLGRRGVPTAIYYPIPLHMQQAFGYLGYREGDFPVSESLSRRIVSLPVFPEMTAEERRMVIGEIASFFAGSNAG